MRSTSGRGSAHLAFRTHRAVAFRPYLTRADQAGAGPPGRPRSRGGEDKFCKIEVVLEDAPAVLIEDAGADLYAVIDRAAERAGRNVAKRVERLRENARLAVPQPPASLPGDAFDMPKN